MSRRLGIVMDAITDIAVKKDSSLAMLVAAKAKGWSLFYMEQSDLFLHQGAAHASMTPLVVFENDKHWFELGDTQISPLTDLDVILMRKDPPFDMEYLYSTYLLEQAEHAGVLVVNHPQSLRDANEKLFTAWFPQCCPATLVTRQADLIRNFQKQHADIILKPLDSMGGTSIFRVKQNDNNLNVIIETLTKHGRQSIMAQQFIPEISKGDKRILMIDGEPVPYALARIPKKGDTRGNIAAGCQIEGQPLSDHDIWICEQVGPTLRKKGLLFVGLDVIGRYLTEINVTSPSCIRELDRIFHLNIAGDLIACIESKLT